MYPSTIHVFASSRLSEMRLPRYAPEYRPYYLDPSPQEQRPAPGKVPAKSATPTPCPRASSRRGSARDQHWRRRRRPYQCSTRIASPQNCFLTARKTGRETHDVSDQASPNTTQLPCPHDPAPAHRVSFCCELSRCHVIPTGAYVIPRAPSQEVIPDDQETRTSSARPPFPHDLHPRDLQSRQYAPIKQSDLPLKAYHPGPLAHSKLFERLDSIFRLRLGRTCKSQSMIGALQAARKSPGHADAA
ncbi:hypothetical protein BKA80DRAFT_300661 [Phyllosticta citrichinensis]